MATSLSNETSSASLVELTHSNQLSGQSMSGTQNYGSSQKTLNQESKQNLYGSQVSNLQQSQNAARLNNQSFSASNSSSLASSTNQLKQKAGAGHCSGIDQVSNLPSGFLTSSVGYLPFIYNQNQLMNGFAQSSQASQYNFQNSSNPNTGLNNNNLQSSQPASSSTQSGRRAGKKKAPTTQPSNLDNRLFFNLRRRDAISQPSRGASGNNTSHYYKPKNPPSIFEWFKKLTVEERVNALSTIYPQLIETLINMHQKIYEKGESSFSQLEPREHQRTHSDFKSQMSQFQYIPFQHNSFSPQISHSIDMTQFEKSFYQRVINETEIEQIKNTEKEKIAAENEILKEVRLTYYFDNNTENQIDTLTVSEDLVQDSDLFFKLMGYATENLAFSSPSTFFFDSKTQQNWIGYPSWFQPKSFHSLAIWVLVSLEENLWAHYNYDNNVNMGSAKSNDLTQLFKEKTDHGAQDVDLQNLSKFWRDMSDTQKKALISTLKINAVREVEQFEKRQFDNGNEYNTKSSKSGHAKGMNYQVQVKERKDQQIEKQNSQIQTESDLNYYIDQSLRQGFEQELMSHLVFTKLGNTHHRQIIIQKEFLNLIKKKFKDDLMENLLLEETIKQNKGPNQAQNKKKKKKNNANQHLQDTSSTVISGNQNNKISLTLTSDNLQSISADCYSQEDQKAIKIFKSQSSNATNSNQIVKQGKKIIKEQSSDHKKSGVQLLINQNGGINGNNTSGRMGNNADMNSYSCDEQQIKPAQSKNFDLEVETDTKSQSLGQKSQSTMCGDTTTTTAHQSNNSNSNSSVTITSTNTSKIPVDEKEAQSLLQIQTSKSLDLNTFSKSQKSSQNSHQKIQQKQSSKVESKNFQILQNNSKTENERRNSKNDKRHKNSAYYHQPSANYQDNIIFSEDDRQSKKLIHIKDINLTSESESESMEIIRRYVLEITNEMINKVCLQSERTNSKSSQRDEDLQNEIVYQQQMQYHNKTGLNQIMNTNGQQPEYFKLGATFNSNNFNNNNQRKKSFYAKKNTGSRKQSNQYQIENQSINEQYQNQHYQNSTNYHSQNYGHQNQYTEKRKISFNNSKKSFKDDKKFSEDFAENISNTSHHQSTSGVSGGHQIPSNQYPQQTANSSLNHQLDSIDKDYDQRDIGYYNNESSNNQKQHHNQNNKNKNQRKGFGVNLKQSQPHHDHQKHQAQEKIEETNDQTNPGLIKRQPQTSKNQQSQSFFNQPQKDDSVQAWAKGTAKQPDIKGKQNQKKNSNQQINKDNLKSLAHSSENKTGLKTSPNQIKNLQSQNDDTISERTFQQSDNLSIADDKSTQDGGGKNKKKRNRKKAKLNDIDIMNNFMKNLQASQDEVKNSTEQKQQSYGTQSNSNANNSYKKKGSQFPSNNYLPPKILQRNSAVSDVQSEKQTYLNKGVSQQQTLVDLSEKQLSQVAQSDSISENIDQVQKQRSQQQNNPSNSHQYKSKQNHHNQPKNGAHQNASNQNQYQSRKDSINTVDSQISNHDQFNANLDYKQNHDTLSSYSHKTYNSQNHNNQKSYQAKNHNQQNQYNQLAHNNSQYCQQQPQYIKQSQQQNQIQSQTHSQHPKNNHYHTQSNKSNHQGPKFQKIQSNNQQKIIEQRNEDVESVNSNVADCISNKSSKSINEKNLNFIEKQILTASLPTDQDLVITFTEKPHQKQQRFSGAGNNLEYFDTGSNENTGTTNTAVDTSVENCANQLEESKEQQPLIIIQDQEKDLQSNNQIQISLTESIDAQHLFKNNAFAYTFQQFSNRLIESTMHQTLQDIQDAQTVPPQLRSPQSNSSSTQATVFTPQYHQSYNYNQLNSSISPSNFELQDKNNENGPTKINNTYQSYQNTPQKNQLPNHKNQHRLQTVPLSAQVSTTSQDSQQSYKTPPQLSKKHNSAILNNYNTSMPYRKQNASTNMQHNHNHHQQQQPAYQLSGNYQNFNQNLSQQPKSTSYSHQQQTMHSQQQQQQQFNMPLQSFQMQQQQPLQNGSHYQPNQKDFYQPQPKNLNFYPQQMPNLIPQMIQEPQFIHQYQENNNMMFYPPDQQMFMTGNPLIDNFQRAQDNVFSYVEKQMAPIHNKLGVPSPMPYYPQNSVPMPNFSPVGIVPPHDPAFSFNFQRKQQPQPYAFDQSQDLIMQMINSIKYNQQSLSPIPQCISSPPPLIEFGQIQSSLDGSLMPHKSDQYAQMQIEDKFYEKFDQEIFSYIATIQASLDRLKPERDFIYNKILTVIREVFTGQNPSLQLFGSLITGLALESSDMDLAVTGLYIEDRFAVVCELNKLSGALQNWDVLESFKSIETASIPVIKMKIDLTKLRNKEMKEAGYSDFDQRPIPEEQNLLSIDITFDDSQTNSMMSQMQQLLFQQQDIMNSTKTHLGLQSCSLVQYFISNYQHLKEVSILLKRFLALHKFNSPYYGGISSYSTVILLVAYMNFFNLKGNNNLSPSRLLMGFLDYYGNHFNTSTQGVNVFNEGSFYVLNNAMDSNIVILDPLNLANNTTRNSYLTKEILQKFQKAFKSLKSLTVKSESESHNNHNKTQEIISNLLLDQKQTPLNGTTTIQSTACQQQTQILLNNGMLQNQHTAAQSTKIATDSILSSTFLAENVRKDLSLTSYSPTSIQPNQHQNSAQISQQQESSAINTVTTQTANAYPIISISPSSSSKSNQIQQKNASQQMKITEETTVAVNSYPFQSQQVSGQLVDQITPINVASGSQETLKVEAEASYANANQETTRGQQIQSQMDGGLFHFSQGISQQEKMQNLKLENTLGSVAFSIQPQNDFSLSSNEISKQQNPTLNSLNQQQQQQDFFLQSLGDNMQSQQRHFVDQTFSVQGNGNQQMPTQSPSPGQYVSYPFYSVNLLDTFFAAEILESSTVLSKEGSSSSSVTPGVAIITAPNVNIINASAQIQV